MLYIYRNISIVRGCCFNERPESNHIKKKWLGQLSGESPHLVWAELLALFRALFKRPCLEYAGDHSTMIS